MSNPTTKPDTQSPVTKTRAELFAAMAAHDQATKMLRAAEQIKCAKERAVVAKAHAEVARLHAAYLEAKRQTY